MIESISIKKLFGRFDYDFSLKSGGVTILTGPNGFGKSTILNIINAVYKLDLDFFLQLDFYEIGLQFDGNRAIKLIKENKKMNIDGIEVSIPTEEDIKRYSSRYHYRPFFLNHDFDNLVADDILRYRYFNDEKYEFSRDKPTAMSVMLSEINSKSHNKLSTKLRAISKLCGKVSLISEQRLIYKDDDKDDQKIIDAITDLPRKLKSEISKVTEEYSKVANSLDSSYPNRLLSAKEGLSNYKEYEKNLDEANTKFKMLNEYNLVNISLIAPKGYDDKYSTALKIYFDDFASKYMVFEKLINKLNMLTEIINDRLLFKKMVISASDGFSVVDVDSPNKKLELSKLSSGEKQEIVLFYNLIFNVESELLLLIDEPEISLHISWQKKFLEDLLKVTQYSKLEVIVATHSPQIINEKWDLQVDLGELYGD